MVPTLASFEDLKSALLHSLLKDLTLRLQTCTHDGLGNLLTLIDALKVLLLVHFVDWSFLLCLHPLFLERWHFDTIHALFVDDDQELGIFE